MRRTLKPFINKDLNGFKVLCKCDPEYAIKKLARRFAGFSMRNNDTVPGALSLNGQPFF